MQFTSTQIDEILKLAEEKGVPFAAQEKGVAQSTIRIWRRIRGIKMGPTFVFSPEVKAQAVADWKASTEKNRTTLTAAKHGVSVISLRKWLKAAGCTLGIAKKGPEVVE